MQQPKNANQRLLKRIIMLLMRQPVTKINLLIMPLIGINMNNFLQLYLLYLCFIPCVELHELI